MRQLAPHGEAFLEELASHLPAGFSAEFDGDLLIVIGPDGSLAGTTADWLTADVLLEEEAVQGAVGSLNLIQTEIAEETTEPWPATAGRSYRGFLEPDGEVVGEDLHAWFGPRDAPVIRLRPISLHGVLLKE